MWNDKETTIDLLGHEKIARTILDIISDNHLRPLTIGVYGDWGVGKSSILSILESIVTAERKAEISKGLCITFNGWLFQGYEDAKTALMETVVTELAAFQPNIDKVKKLAKSLLSRINWLKVAKVVAGATLTGLTGLPIGGIAGTLIERAHKATEDSEGKSDESLLKDKEEETVTSQIHAFRKELKELIESSKIDHIIVMVDDLDRCLPKSVIEILEAIRLFLFVEGTTFVISADERMIEYAVRGHFPNLPASYADYTKNYLEKLIQIPIRIPTLTRLQTGNYIKLLMLQHFLKHDFARLQAVYGTYSGKKKRPYDPIELSYDFITEAIGSTSDELKETLSVADQLTATLSLGLKGNPRNIKRFLNTLFLRMRIARIYGLDDVVKLNVLAKLMLLERFQSDAFSRIVDDVAASTEGKSDLIQKGETPTDIAAGTSIHQPLTDELTRNGPFLEWATIQPPIGSLDLRPYIFISKEKAIGFEVEGQLPEHLAALLESLNSSSDIALKKAERELGAISLKDRQILFDRLQAESRSVGDLKNIPTPVHGLLRLINVESSFEDPFLSLLESFPVANLGVWAISQLSGLKTPSAKERFRKILAQWRDQTENKMLSNLASQTLK
ncbi:MAG TPA: Qat anti-phage system ATPase QatA [Puia sp.]|jgi:predicted KAP-like P-loop ATPase